MANINNSKASHSSIRDRFIFLDESSQSTLRAALEPALFDVEEKTNGAERCLKLWRKAGSEIDQSLRELWLHEMRQVQRIMAYAGAKEVVIDVQEFVEDDQDFGIVFAKSGSPLATMLDRVSRSSWLKNTTSPRPRTLLWQNVARIAKALDIIHAQGLVHGRIGLESIFTYGDDDPDFQLSGFEWSIWLGDSSNHGKLNASDTNKGEKIYSFAQDWKALGHVIAHLLNVRMDAKGDPVAKYEDTGVILTISERNLLKRLIAPSRLESLDGAFIENAIKDIIIDVANSTILRAGTFVMWFGKSNLAEAVYQATNGAIAIDEHYQQLDWVRADLDNGVKLLVPRKFDPKTGRLKLVSSTMVYRLQAFRDNGNAFWDIAVCNEMTSRETDSGNGNYEEHLLDQPINLVSSVRKAKELCAQLGPAVLDWSAFAATQENAKLSDHEIIKKALLLVQVLEAVIKTLEIYPIEVASVTRKKGQHIVFLKAGKHSDRDRLANKFKSPATANALRRLFEDDMREANTKWSIGPSQGLGAKKNQEISATFNDINEINGIRVYEFETDGELDTSRPLFLRPEGDTGTEHVIRRRLRNLSLLETRVDLLDNFDDPWRVRRTSREVLSESDEAFEDLDAPKKEALRDIWKTLPTYFVIGPPGVGKTRLATEVVTRRLLNDRSTRILLSSQGHDALDNLQRAVTKALKKAEISDAIVVRSTVPPDRRAAEEADVHQAVSEYLRHLTAGDLVRSAPKPLRDRIAELSSAITAAMQSGEILKGEDRVGIEAFSNLILDAANIVISTANSPDIERMVEEREQFDSVIIEEAAKATGPELAGPLMLAGRRLLIGDHHQLPPFDCDRMITILSDHSAVLEMLKAADQRVGYLFNESGLEELEDLVDSPEALKMVASKAARLLQPFKTFTEEDDRRLDNPAHRPISKMLTEQRRMDPAIEEIVSSAFYPNRLTTSPARKIEAEEGIAPFIRVAPLPQSPVVIVNFDHVSSTGKERRVELGSPRWHNPDEVEAVINVLRCIRASQSANEKPTIAILSPYSAQVEKIRNRINQLKGGELSHLKEFGSVREGMDFVGTVDSFQGSEADFVLISLVRNNPRTGRSALGFLTDRRRMNVLLSRAKYQMVIVGSTRFLREAVKGVNPEDGEHDLDFITTILNKIQELQSRKRADGIPLATVIKPGAIGGKA